MVFRTRLYIIITKENQRVVVDWTYHSKFQGVTLGFPHGSILGPLFYIYTQKIFLRLSTNPTSYYMLTIQMSLWHKKHHFYHSNWTISTSCNHWFSNYGLKRNPDNTQLFYFHLKYRISLTFRLNIIWLIQCIGVEMDYCRTCKSNVAKLLTRTSK